MPTEEKVIQKERPGADCIGFHLYQSANVFYGVFSHLPEKAKATAEELLKNHILNEANTLKM